MKRIVALALAMAAGTPAWGGGDCCRGGKALPWQGYNRGVRWTGSPAEAMKRAREEDRPVLLFQLVGDLDKEGC